MRLVIESGAVVFSKNTNFQVNGWESLRPYRIGYISGNKWVVAKTGGMQTVPAPDMSGLFKMLDAGRVDVAVVPKEAGEQTIRNLGLTGIRPLAPALMNTPLYHFLNKKHQLKIARLQDAL